MGINNGLTGHFFPLCMPFLPFYSVIPEIIAKFVRVEKENSNGV